MSEGIEARGTELRRPARRSPGEGRFKPYPAYRDSGVERLGEIPAHWEVKRLKFVAVLNPAASEVRGLTPDTEVSFVPMEAVGEHGGLDLSRTKLLADVRTGYTYFRDGDVVVAKITPCFENGKGALAARLVNGIAFGTTELHVLRATQALDDEFLFYLTLSNAFRRLGEAEMYGASGQKRVPESFVENLRYPLPSVLEQRAIAAFLDEETARIDALVAKKERLIELLLEKRTALITRAVTKGLPAEAAPKMGLDPNVPMKDSGVEWLGEITAHWNVTLLKHAAARIADCPHETPVYSDDGEHFVVRTSDLSEGRLDVSNARRVDDGEYQRRIRRLRLIPDDVVYSREGERFGFAATVPSGVSVCLGQRMMQFRTGVRWWPRFLMWQLNSKSVRQQASLDITGATSPHVNVETIRRFILAEPPFAEQQAIAAFVDAETVRFDSLITKVHNAIDRLKELRTALISAAVTGKIDVREEAT